MENKERGRGDAPVGARNQGEGEKFAVPQLGALTGGTAQKKKKIDRRRKGGRGRHRRAAEKKEDRKWCWSSRKEFFQEKSSRKKGRKGDSGAEGMHRVATWQPAAVETR